MEQITIIPEGKMTINLTVKKSRIATLLKPVVFEDDHSYCCLLGDDLRYGIKGFGHTVEEAMDDWETSLKKRIENPFINDGLAYYVINQLHNHNL